MIIAKGKDMVIVNGSLDEIATEMIALGDSLTNEKLKPIRLHLISVFLKGAEFTEEEFRMHRDIERVYEKVKGDDEMIEKLKKGEVSVGDILGDLGDHS